jgi:hypothetical protein
VRPYVETCEQRFRNEKTGNDNDSDGGKEEEEEEEEEDH